MLKVATPVPTKLFVWPHLTFGTVNEVVTLAEGRPPS